MNNKIKNRIKTIKKKITELEKLGVSLDVADGIISFIDILAFEKENDRV